VDPSTRFEAAVIRAGEPDGGVLIRMTPGGLEATNMPIGVLLRQALQKADYQIIGAPDWIARERYSIRAKGPAGIPPSAAQVMLLNLLKDRFQLTTRLETRELPILHLVMARADGRPGPDLRPTPVDCQATLAERQAAAKRGEPPPPPTSFPDPNAPLPCGFGRIGPGMAAFSGRAIAQLLPTLSDLMGRPVIDKTGLTGLFEIALKYAPEPGRNAGPFGPPPPGTPAPVVDPDTPSLAAALQEQLGLKLESARGPVEVVVIDKLEKPTLD
jgi:uncharacterized protein (TIGR03435 family)